jgi:hypothetical protein
MPPLGEPGMAHGVVAGRPEAALQQTPGQPLDHLVVLGVDHDRRTLAPGDRKDVEHLPVV